MSTRKEEIAAKLAALKPVVEVSEDTAKVKLGDKDTYATILSEVSGKTKKELKESYDLNKAYTEAAVDHAVSIATETRNKHKKINTAEVVVNSGMAARDNLDVVVQFNKEIRIPGPEKKTVVKNTVKVVNKNSSYSVAKSVISGYNDQIHDALQ